MYIIHNQAAGVSETRTARWQLHPPSFACLAVVDVASFVCSISRHGWIGRSGGVCVCVFAQDAVASMPKRERTPTNFVGVLRLTD